MDDVELGRLAARVGEILQAAGERLVLAESCTGGWVAKVVTDIAGSSAWFDRGFVTYSNLAKQEMLGVPEATLTAHGAVSREVATAMVAGALAGSRARVAVALTGVAGPGGGTEDKPVGLVWLAWHTPGVGTWARAVQLDGDREAVRRQSVAVALETLVDPGGEAR